MAQSLEPENGVCLVSGRFANWPSFCQPPGSLGFTAEASSLPASESKTSASTRQLRRQIFVELSRQKGWDGWLKSPRG